MKALIVLSLTLISLNAFTAEVGEDKKGECKFGPQSGRQAKPVIASQDTAQPAVSTKAAGK